MSKHNSLVDDFEAAGNALLDALRNAFGCARLNSRFLATQAILPFVAQCSVGLLALLRLPDSTAETAAPHQDWLVAIAWVATGAIYLPFVVSCHRLVLFGRATISDGVHFKIGKTERRLLWAFARLAGIAAVGIAVVTGTLTTLIVALKFSKLAITLLVLLVGGIGWITFVSLTAFTVPAVVSGVANPLRTAIHLASQNKMLMLLFVLAAFLLRLAANAASGALGGAVPLEINHSPVVSVILTSTFTVLATAFGALVLSLLYIKVQPASDAALAPARVDEPPTSPRPWPSLKKFLAGFAKSPDAPRPLRQRWAGVALFTCAILFNVYVIAGNGGMGAVFSTFRALAGLGNGRAVASNSDFEHQAERGDAYAQFRMGVRYEFGQNGTAKNINEAVRYYTLSANQGNWKAQYNLALIYERGQGEIPKDEAKAAELFKLAADQGDPSAYISLALMHHNGRGGLRQDHIEAARLLKLAADKDDPLGQYYLAQYYSTGDGGLTADEAEAAKLFRKSADRGLLEAEITVAQFYAKGSGGLERNDNEAVRLYKSAAAKNSGYGLIGLASMYEEGRGGLPTDLNQARQLAERARALGFKPAQAYIEHLEAKFLK